MSFFTGIILSGSLCQWIETHQNQVFGGLNTSKLLNRFKVIDYKSLFVRSDLRSLNGSSGKTPLL